MSAVEFEYANQPVTKTVKSANTIDTSTPGPLPPLLDNIQTTTQTNNTQQYIYQYGIKNIDLSYSLYHHAGVFVTKPMEVEGNVIEVSLSSKEEHPLFNELDGMATNRLTSIEYYISLEDNPSNENWIAILPEETTSIKCEKLFFKVSSATLRFHADINDLENTHVYKNNLRLNKEEWYFTNRGATVQLTSPCDTNAIYTIDYIPDTKLNNPWIIQVSNHSSQKIRYTETFANGTDSNNTIKLSKYPFIDYNLINTLETYEPNMNDYRPFDVFLKNGNIAIGNGQTQKEFYPAIYANGSEFQTINRTDYKTATDVLLKRYSIIPDSLYRKFEYKQEKNKLIFTESFNRSNLYYNEATNHGDATIEVQYDYLVTHFRLKIILRKNTGDELIVTPMIDSYQLKFKVMK